MSVEPGWPEVDGAGSVRVERLVRTWWKRDDALNEKDAAVYCGLSSTRLRQFRLKGTGPKTLEDNPELAPVWYVKKELDTWLSSRKR